MDIKNNDKTIREFAQKQNIEDIYKQYKYVSKNRPDLKNHNGYYHNLIFFIRHNYLELHKISSIPMDFNFEEYFIDELFKIDSDKHFCEFMKNCCQYDSVVSILDQAKVNQLWIEFGKVKHYTNRVLENKEQQRLIKSFHNLYSVDTYQSKEFLINADQIAFRLFLLDGNPVNLQFYRTYLYTCELKNGVYQPSKEKGKKAFHEFNVWLDEFYKKNKLKNHRLEDEEKYFYLYLLKEANEICKVFSSYFYSNNIEIDWHEHRKESLKTSKRWLSEYE